MTQAETQAIVSLSLMAAFVDGHKPQIQQQARTLDVAKVLSMVRGRG